MILTQLLESNHSAWSVAILGVGLNSSSHMSEHLRGNVLAVDTTQYEAAQSLGSKPYEALKLVIFPQVLKNSIPSLLNEFPALIKEMAVVGVTLGLTDLTELADKLSKERGTNWLYYLSCFIYISHLVG
jgi:ABC-type amino acid transport system permease subunit